MSELIVTAGVVVAGQLLSLLALWLRLRSRIQWEDAHRRSLIAVAQAMPQGGAIHERRADGSCLTFAVAHTQTSERIHG
jgi:hypothetical protein